MRKFLMVITTATLILAAAMLPAGAATSDTTTTTFVISGGGLSISVPTSVNLGSGTTGANDISAQLGTVTVDDARGALSGSWTASVSSTDFVTGGGTPNETISAGNVKYWSGLATATSGIAVRTPGQATALAAQTLDTTRTAFSAVEVVGNNSTSWNPTVIVNVPSNVVAGTYTGTITHSVA